MMQRLDDKDVVSFFKRALNVQNETEKMGSDIDPTFLFSEYQWKEQVAKCCRWTKWKKDIPCFCQRSD